MGRRQIGALVRTALLAFPLGLVTIPAIAQEPDLPLPIIDVGSRIPGFAARASGPTGITAEEFPLSQIAEIRSSYFATVVFGDTDHDGRNEAILNDYHDDATAHYIILEEQGDNSYSVEYSGPALIPFAIGDLDLDGKSDIVGQKSGIVYVYESVDATSYPTELVWSSEFLSSITGSTTVGDTDRDGRMEIIHSQNSLGNSNLLIFENTDDNTFELVYSNTVVGNGPTGDKVVADLDGDGLIEIAFSGLFGGVFVYESPANNAWQLVWSENTGMSNAYGAKGGSDTDGNGKPELFIMGNNPGWTTIVYEAVGDNQFASVDAFFVDEGFSGGNHNALGNLDGVGPDEYVMQGACYFWVYRAVAPGNWVLIQEVPDPSACLHLSPHTYDVNQNGKDELFWTSERESTLVLEYPGVPTSVQIRPRPLITISSFPNPARMQATLGVEMVDARVSVLAVFDAAGRLVERRVANRNSRSQLVWPVQHLSSGIYFLRLEDRAGAALAVGRGMVVR